MGAGRLELPQPCGLRILSPLRLPIPPCPRCHRMGFGGFGQVGVCSIIGRPGRPAPAHPIRWKHPHPKARPWDEQGRAVTGPWLHRSPTRSLQLWKKLASELHQHLSGSLQRRHAIGQGLSSQVHVPLNGCQAAPATPGHQLELTPGPEQLAGMQRAAFHQRPAAPGLAADDRHG